ncbi:MAG TPA: c-type cytochrome [Rhodanobacteraceae bacterium]|nr:c-type cytochrome [Rhodanobacteraceae bacterium]
MSCKQGEPCREVRYRGTAIAVLALMAVIFLGLSVFSFLPSRGQVLPSDVRFDGHTAVEGKRVFQAFNCMGCHTIVGNGAYFGPDLTNIYALAGPAWLAAFIPSAGTWPTKGALLTQMQAMKTELGKDGASAEAYMAAFPGSKDRIERRGGQKTHMPNLQLDANQVAALTAFFKYTAELNKEGWPPKPQVDGLAFLAAEHASVPVAAASGSTTGAPAAEDPAVKGKALAVEYACTACHSTTGGVLVGPSWAGLYGHQVKLADGSQRTADAAYLIESIKEPNAAVVAGFTPGTMTSYASLLDDSQIDAIVAYIKSLKGSAP